MSGIEGPRKSQSLADRWRAEADKATAPRPSVPERISPGPELLVPKEKKEEPERLVQSEQGGALSGAMPQRASMNWSDKKVDISSINLRTLPVNWNAIADIGKSINQIAGNPVTRQDIVALKPPTDVYPGIPMVASVIAHRRNKEIPIRLPTKEDIGNKRVQWYVDILYKYINPFSQKIAERFRGYVEQEGERTVLKTGLKIADVADIAGSIENPRQQLLKETALLYRILQQPEIDEGFLYDGEVTVEDKILGFLDALKEAKYNPKLLDDTSYALNNRDFPLLLKLLPKLNLPSDTFDTWSASVAGAELMQGLEVFLRRQGMPDIEPAPLPQEIDLFDATSWPRAYAEWFKGEKLERVKNGLPVVFEHALDALPTNGPEFADQMYALAENVCALHAQGKSSGDIAHHMFVKDR